MKKLLSMMLAVAMVLSLCVNVFAVKENASSVPEISIGNLSGRVGDIIRVTPALTQGRPGGTWSESGLPVGLSINADTGAISGIPTAAGSGTFTVTYTDPNGRTGSVQAQYSVREDGDNARETYTETAKLGAYEGRFIVFDTEAAEEDESYIQKNGLSPAPEGYGYYRADMRVRLTYGGVDDIPELYPSGGVILLALGSTADGPVYPSADALTDGTFVDIHSLGGYIYDNAFAFPYYYGRATNYAGSMTYENGVLQARCPFSVISKNAYQGVDEQSNRYGEFEISLRGLLVKPESDFSVSVSDWYGSDGKGSISYIPVTTTRMLTTNNISGRVSIPVKEQVVSFTKDNVETDVIKIMRWQGMDAASTGEPTNRGYDSTMKNDTLGVLINGKPLAYNEENLDKAKELFASSVIYEIYRADGFIALSVSENNSGLVVKGNNKWGYCDVLSVSFGINTYGNIIATFTSLAPAALRLTMEDGSEFLLITPGDVNLDGSMDANDWTTIMRWTLEAPGKYDTSPDDARFTVTVNEKKYNLWILMADMTAELARDSSDSSNWSDMVNAIDWSTLMYLTLEAWKR